MRVFFGKFYGDDAAEAKAKAEADAKIAADKVAAEKAATEAAKLKLFTQDEVNAMMADHRRTLQAKVAELSTQTADLPKYQAKIKELNESLMTKDELAKQEAERQKREHETAVSTATTERDQWKKNYLQNVFDVEFGKAASKQDVFDADQFSLILKDRCQVVEVTDDTGKGTGKYKVTMSVEENGKPLTLSCEDGLAKLKEQGKFPNQFKVGKVPGTGGSNFGSHDKPVGNGMPTYTDFQKLARQRNT
jgi:hypothetical protein